MNKLTDAERDAFVEHLHKYAGRCPYCGASKVGATEKVVSASTLHRDEDRMDLEDVVPMVLAVCQSCGFSLYFSAELIDGVDAIRRTAG